MKRWLFLIAVAALTIGCASKEKQDMLIQWANTQDARLEELYGDGDMPGEAYKLVERVQKFCKLVAQNVTNITEAQCIDWFDDGPGDKTAAPDPPPWPPN